MTFATPDADVLNWVIRLPEPVPLELPVASMPRAIVPPPRDENRAKSLALLLTKKFEPVAETVPGYEATIWLGIMAPKGTPKEIVDKLNGEITKAANSPEMKAEWGKQGALAMSMSPDQFEQYLKQDIEKWARVVKISGARQDR